MNGVNGPQELPNASFEWYINSTRNSSNIRQTLEKQFSKYNQGERKKISYLIEVLGFENFLIVHKILGENAQAAYSFEFNRLKNVKMYCLSDLLNEQTFNLLAINEFKLYDHISAHSPKDTKQLVLADIKIYLTSVCMPAPEAKALGCYKFDKLKKYISAYDKELQNAILRLFKITQTDDQIPTIREEQLLCKHGCVKGGEKSLNWGSILYLWLLTEKPNGTLLEWLNQRSSFNRLLSKEGIKKNPSNISFKDYVIKNTVIFLFAHKNSIFIPPKNYLEELKQNFLDSESNRQNVVYFMDYLYGLLKKKDDFPIEKSLFVLNQLFEDEKTVLYDFLHIVLYYFYYYHRFSIDQKHRALVFQSICSVPLQERKKIAKIKDKYIRESFVIKENYAQPKSFDTLYYLGFIFLRQLIEKGDQKCPYMSVNKHFEFIQSCEHNKGPLPKDIVTSILLHQTLMPQIEDSLTEIRNLSNEISSGNINLISDWGMIKTDLLKCIGKVNLEGTDDPDQEKKKLMRMEQLSYLLLFSTHPSFKKTANNFDFEEFDVFEGKIVLKKELSPVEEQVIDYINSLSLIPPDQGFIAISTLIDNHKSQIYDFFNSFIYYSHLYKKEFVLKRDEFLFSSIIFLFAYENCILIPPKNFLEELKQNFLESESNRQNFVHFMDYLYGLQQNNDDFPIEKSLVVLNQRVEDEKTFLYDFLHAVLYYFYYHHRFSILPDHRALVFQSICSVPLQERKKIAKIKDKYIRESFVINENIAELKSFDSLYYLGFIFLRQLIEKGDQKCPYMSVNKHFEFIQNCEDIIEGPLPKDIVTSILLHQTLTRPIEGLLIKIRELAKEISSEKISYIILHRWKYLKIELLSYIGKANLEGINDPDQEKKRLMRMEQLSYLLLFSTHPSFKKTVNNFDVEELDVFAGKMELKNDLSPVEKQVIEFINELSLIPLDQGLIAISTLIENHKSKIYNSFNKFIYYSHLYKKEFGQKGDEFLLSSIDAMSLEQRRIFETPIEEKGIVRGPWKIDNDLLDFAESHLIPPSEWGKIFLRSSSFLNVENENTNFTFLTLNKHIELIKLIEELFGSTLDPKICADLLYFQMANNSMFDLMEQFKSIRTQLKEERTRWPALSFDSYLETINSAKIFESIKDVCSSKKLCASSNRSDFFMTDVVGPIAVILAFASYPIPLISFQKLIENTSEFELFQPMHDLFPKGPTWKACWEKDESACLYTLIVCVTNPEKCNQNFIQFNVPLKIPKDLDKRKNYLLLLYYAVDNLGKEVFHDNEYERLEAMRLEPQKLTQDILNKDNGKERLNALLECSPLVKLEWQKFFPFVEDNEDYEIHLFIFIQTLRRKFLDSFYYILNPEKGNLEEGLTIEKESWEKIFL